MTARILKIFIVCCWLALLVSLVQRDFFIHALESDEQEILIQAKHQQYYGVHLHNNRIGYVMEDIRPYAHGEGEEGVRIRQQASLRLKVLNSVQPITMKLNATAGNGLQLRTSASWGNCT